MQEIFFNAKRSMQNSLDRLLGELSNIKAGRANPKILDKISIDYYENPTPINQLAAISVSEARVLVIQPWEASLIKEIEKAINIANLGINPQNDGKVIRLIFPQLTEEIRRNIVKDILKMSEDIKISIRASRRDAIEKLKKMKKESIITEDELRSSEKNIQDLTDEFCNKIDKIASAKQEEIMNV